ncbi:hypothetical protein [Streptomyces sp. NPDC001889]
MAGRRLGVAAALGVPAALIWAAELTAFPDEAIPLLAVALLASPFPLLVSVLALIHTPRTARVLQCYAWRSYPCRYPQGSQRRSFAIAVTVAPGEEILLRTTPYRRGLGRRRSDRLDTIWFAGDPAAGGVLSPVGGARPVRALRTALWESGAQVPPADAQAERAGLAREGRFVRRWF